LVEATPAAVFERFGLGSPGFWGGSGIPIDGESSDGLAKGLCTALAKLGGLYAAFGCFLGWRADLFDASYIAQFRRISLNPTPVPSFAVAATIRRELGPGGAEPAASLESVPLWNTLTRTAYRSSYRKEAVVVEVARPSFAEAAFADFRKGLRALSHPELAGIVAPSVVAQFYEWMRNGESLANERSFLEVLRHHHGETLVQYPLLIPEICSPSVLCWPVIEGRSLTGMIEQGDSAAPVLAATAILEQFFSLSMVEGDLSLDAMVVDPDNRLHFRRLGNPIAVLPGVINTGMEYVSAVLSGNASLSAQKLIRLIIAQPPLELDRLLMEEFSGIEPELKINMWYPPSAAVFESNWRALAKVDLPRPLYLDCLNRNLIATGYWNSDVTRAGAPERDAISEAQKPVVNRLIRSQVATLANVDSAREWAIGSSLFMIGTMREMSRLVEEFRENDITVGVNASEWRKSEPKQSRVLYQILLGVLLVFFLSGLQWGSSVGEPWSLALKILAAAALPAMFWAISRIG
jgi:hypothetical protein